MNKSGMTSIGENRVDAVVAAYLAEVRAGHAPDPAVWLARYPQWSAELAGFFADYDWARTCLPSPYTQPQRPTAGSHPC